MSIGLSKHKHSYAWNVTIELPDEPFVKGAIALCNVGQSAHREWEISLISRHRLMLVWLAPSLLCKHFLVGLQLAAAADSAGVWRLVRTMSGSRVLRVCAHIPPSLINRCCSHYYLSLPSPLHDYKHFVFTNRPYERTLAMDDQTKSICGRAPCTNKQLGHL